jgi:hypothetical protein
VDDIIDGIISNKYKYHETLDFEESITTFKKPIRKTTSLNWPTKLPAKGCEFKTTPEQEQEGLLSVSNIASQSNINGQHQNSSKPMPCKSGLQREEPDGKPPADAGLTEDDFNIKPIAGRISLQKDSGYK